MHADLGRLIDLQRIENLLRQKETLLQEIPRRRAERDAELSGERKRLDQAKEALGSSQKNKRGLESAVQDLETKRSRYKTQLMEVKTNKEYTAMLHEIEGVEKEIRSKEDVILQEMEQAEALQADVKREEHEFKRIENEHKAAVAVLDKESGELTAVVEKLRAERQAVASTLSEDVRELYERVSKRRGTGVAEVRDEMCQVCHLKLRPQMYVDLKRQDEIMQCPGCSRILFYEAPPPVVVPPGL